VPDSLPIPAAPSGQAPEPAALSPLDKLLIDIPDLAQVTSLSVRHLRRLDSSGDIPGRVVHGRRVLFQTEVIREWVRAGLPDRDRWAVLQRRNGKR
jgi:hypothetical protein